MRNFFCIILFLVLTHIDIYSQAPQSGGMKPQCGAAAPVYGITNDGKEFFLGMLNPSFTTVSSNSLQKYFQVYALVTTHYDNEISVSYFMDDGSETNPIRYRIQAKQSVKILLNVNAFAQMLSST